MQSGGMIPVLRLDHARAADGTFAPAFLDDLRSALHEVGFLQLTDYGAAPGQIAELTELTRRFFALPLAERLALDNRRSPHFRGYTRLGHEITAGRPDAREQLDFGPEQPPLPRAAWDAPFDLLRGPNQWPEALPELAGATMAWAALLGRVGTELTRALATALGAPADHFDGAFAGEPHWFGKLIRYVGQASDGPEAQGVGPHADWGFLTLLLQDDTGGLQARPPRAPEWVDVPPLDGALVINVGEMLEVATDGYLVATDHRVLPCAPGTTRQSIGIFWSPRLDATLDALPLRPELAAEAPGVSQHAHNALLPRFGDNALKGWLRSHPEVAARHHPDLVAAG
jgi:isopenicillin N synthase-like dioxygenase